MKATKAKSNPNLKNISEEIERVKLDLLSLVSHELRTPLTSILNSLKLMQEGELSKPEKQKFLEMAMRNAEKLNHTLNELLDLSKLVSGQLVCRFQELPLKNLLLVQLEKWVPQAESQGHPLDTIEIPDLPVLLGDGPRLAQVFNALFENALKFSPAHSPIHFNVRQTEKNKQRSVQIEFSNTVAASQARTIDLDILKVFSQRETVLDRVHEGVGGSLAIAAEVLRQHGGSIIVDVDLEAATPKFSALLTLPVLENEQALLKILESRIYALKNEVGALSLVLFKVPARSLKAILEVLKSTLFRASDSVYALTDKNEIAVIMNDCKKEDAPKIVQRWIERMGSEGSKFFSSKEVKVGYSSCPEDSTEPEKLLQLARKKVSFTSERCQ